MIWLYIIFGVIWSLFLIYLIYIKYEQLQQIKNGTYPANISVDKLGHLIFSPNLSKFPPRIIHIFEENKEDPGKSTLVPIVCKDEETLYYYKDFFKTCQDVWNWERQEFGKYRTFVEDYIKKNS